MSEAGKMPLILDNTMQVDLHDVDDLFGDSVALSLPVRPPSKQLQQRFDELRARGCCQSIAWSRSGTIATITPDGRTIQFRFLRFNPEDGTWGLSEPTTYDLITALPATPIVHLAWAQTTSPELAVIDAAGRVSILTFQFALNRPLVARKWDADPVDDLHAVVGSYWLNLMPQNRQYNVFHGPAVKEPSGIGYRYESSFVHATGPWHPNPAKSALITVTDNGMLKMYWSQNNNKMEETPLELESINASDDLVTHATIASDKASILIALATASKHLRIIRVNIQWGQPQSDKQIPPGSMPLSPVLKEKHVADTSWLLGSPGESHLDPSMVQLTHLESLPTILDNTGGGWAPPVILAVRSYIPTENSPYQELQTIIDRWEILNDQPQTVHSTFEQLGSRRNSAGAAPNVTTRLRKLDSIVLNKLIVGIHTFQFGKIVCIAFSDGSVEYRDRHTMEEMYTEQSIDRVMTLNQVGFTLAEEMPCLQAAFSPTGCSVARMCEDGKVKWGMMHYPHGDIGNSNQDPQYAAIIAALTVTASSAIFYHMSYDDILAIARPYTQKTHFIYDWTSEIVRMLKIPVNYLEESHHDSLVRNTSLQLCLSILCHLGFRGEFQPRSFASKFAMLALNARNVVILITIASNTPINIREKLSPLDENEVVDALSGCAKWSLDLLSWLSDCLFSLMDDPKFMELLNPTRYGEMTKYLTEKNDVSLHLLLCSSTRGFLSAVCRRLVHLEELSNRAIEFYERRTAMQTATDPGGGQGKIPHALHKAYRKMQSVTSSSLIRVQEFDRLLSNLGVGIRGAYEATLPKIAAKTLQSAAGSGGPQPTGKVLEVAMKNAQIVCELTMFLAGPPPQMFLSVITKLFGNSLKEYKSKTERAELFFSDFSLLEVEDDRRCLATKKRAGRYVDVFKRIELNSANVLRGVPPGDKNAPPLWRRCVRCAAVMEDVSGTRPGFTFVLAQQRKCACGGHWGLLARGKLVS